MNLYGLRNALLLALCSVLAACAGVPLAQGRAGAAVEFKAGAAPVASEGTVLLQIYWDPVWGCGEAERAKLTELGFSRLPLKPGDWTPDVLLQDEPAMLAPKNGWVPYALHLPAGRYGLSRNSVYLVRSVDQVFRWSAAPDKLFDKNGQPLGGSFTVKAGETVYIGNFALDCFKTPMLWRYYTRQTDLPADLKNWQTRYPGLDTGRVVYRLFETQVFGRPVPK